MKGKIFPIFFIALILSLTALFFSRNLIWAASWPDNLNFPRVQSRHHWGWGTPFNYDPIRFSKYDHLGFTSVLTDSNGQLPVDFTKELKNQNPDTRTRIYVNPNNTTEDQTYPGHFLFYPGSRLGESVDTEETAITVADGANFKPGYDGMFWDFTDINDAEHIRITAVNGNQLTVVRGYKGSSTNPAFSPKKNHAQNTYLSIHVSKGQNSNEWYPNWALLCKNGKEKECGAVYQNYADYKVPLWINAVTSAKTDGLKIDNTFGPWIKDDNYGLQKIDINNDGFADGGVVSGKNLWAEGLLEMYKRLRDGLPDALIHGNGASVNPYLNGKLYQGWNRHLLNNWAGTMVEYLRAMTGFNKPQFILADSEVLPDQYREVRFGLASTLMGDGFYGNKGEVGGVAHGPDTWYDEYDNGAGSSLVTKVDASQNYLDIFPGTGSRFNPGDEVYLFEENMKVLEVQNDRLIVQRAYVSDYLASLVQKVKPGQKANPTTHQKGEKVYTIEQVKKQKGYLGKPLSKQNANCSPTSVDSCIRYFTNGVVLVNPSASSHTFPLNGTYYRINGTQDRSVNNGKKVNASVTVPGRDGLILVKNSQPGDADGDGNVDGVDYVVWLNHYDQDTKNGASEGDFNGSNHVDGVDYVIWWNNAD